MRYSIALLVHVILLANCAGPLRDSKDCKIMTLKGPSGMGMVWTIDSIRKSSESTVKIEIFDEPLMLRSKILKGEPDLAFVPMNMAAILYNFGAPYTLLAVPVWGTLFLIGHDSTLTTWDSLRNQRIYLMARGMTPDILFRYLLQKNGIKPYDEVLLDYSFPTHIDLANAVISERADLAVLSEPLVTLVEQKNPSVQHLIDLNQAWMKSNQDSFELPQTALMVKEDFAVKSSEVLANLIASMTSSFEKVIAQPGLSAELMVTYGIIENVELAERSIPGCRLNFEMATDVTESIYNYLRVLYDFNPDAVGGKIPDEEFIYKK